MNHPTRSKKRPGNLRARFVDEYLIDQNATEAAIRAGYSPRTAYSQGHRLLKDVEVSAEIVRRGSELAASKGITADRVMQELGNAALLDPLDLFNDDGTLKPLDQVPESARRAIAGIEIKEVQIVEADSGRLLEIRTQVKKIRLVDKKGALDSIAKILGMMRDRVEVSGQVTLGQLLGQSKAELD